MEVHVHLAAAGLLVDEADEETAVTVHESKAVPLTADAAVERIRHPAGAVDRRIHTARKLLPATLPRSGT